MMQVRMYVQVHMMHVHNMHEWLMHVCMVQIAGILDPDTCMTRKFEELDDKY